VAVIISYVTAFGVVSHSRNKGTTKKVNNNDRNGHAVHEHDYSLQTFRPKTNVSAFEFTSSLGLINVKDNVL